MLRPYRICGVDILKRSVFFFSVGNQTLEENIFRHGEGRETKMSVLIFLRAAVGTGSRGRFFWVGNPKDAFFVF